MNKVLPTFVLEAVGVGPVDVAGVVVGCVDTDRGVFGVVLFGVKCDSIIPDGVFPSVVSRSTSLVKQINT